MRQYVRALALALTLMCGTVAVAEAQFICAKTTLAPARYKSGQAVVAFGEVHMTMRMYLGAINAYTEKASYRIDPNPVTVLETFPNFRRWYWWNPGGQFLCTRLIRPGTGTSSSNPAQFITIYDQLTTEGYLEGHDWSIDTSVQSGGTSGTGMGGGGDTDTSLFAFCVWYIYTDVVTGQVVWTVFGGCY